MTLRVPLIFALALAAAVGAATDGDRLPAAERHSMARGYFLAASAFADPDALGGFAPSRNHPREIERPASPGVVSLIARPDEPASFEGRYRGFLVVLANATSETAAFAASDSRLSVVREAVDTHGAWKPIEYLPSSWCGNSYHRVFLPTGEAWTFTAPVYEGKFATRMRFVLRPGGGAPAIYSNEFPGAIDPRQFSVKQGHEPAGVMDPYLD